MRAELPTVTVGTFKRYKDDYTAVVTLDRLYGGTKLYSARLAVAEALAAGDRVLVVAPNEEPNAWAVFARYGKSTDTHGGGGGSGSSNVVTGTGDASSTSITRTTAGAGSSAAAGVEAVAIGAAASAMLDRAVAIGQSTQATNVDSTAVGAQALADAVRALALGADASALGTDSIAIGSNAQGLGDGDLAIGLDSAAGSGLGSNMTAVGADATATGDRFTALGYNAVVSGDSGVAVGDSTLVLGAGAVALGKYAHATGASSIAIGESDLPGVNAASGLRSIVIGYMAKAAGDYAVALGNGAYAPNANDFVLGNSSHNVQVPGSLSVTGAVSFPGLTIAESQVTGLIADLTAKATDTAVVHLANNETLSGQKTFSNRSIFSALQLFETTRTPSTGAVSTTSNVYQGCDASTGSITAALPATTTAGILFIFKKTDSSANPVTITATSIEGASSVVLSARYDSVWVISTSVSGTWRILSKYPATGKTRMTATVTTGTLGVNASSTTTIPIALGYRLLSIQTSRPARVRLYSSAAAQTADASRAVGTDPTSNAGVVFDYVTTSNATFTLSPLVDGASLESTPSTSIPITITNTDTVSGTVAVTLAYIQTE